MANLTVETKDAPAPIGPYSQAVIAGGWLMFTAGQIAIDPGTGQLLEGDIRTQTRRVLENLKAILEKGGSSLANVVKTTVYLSDMDDFAGMNEVYAEFFASRAPARSTLEASRLPRDVRVEIDAVAAIGS